MRIEEFQSIVEKVKAAGYSDEITWQENVGPPPTAEAFASEAIFVICNSGMKHTVARRIYNDVMAALSRNTSLRDAFGHRGKIDAICLIWDHRHGLFRDYLAAKDKLAFLVTLPWIGDVTKYHLAKNFGLQVAKPDVHLNRLAKHYRTTAQALCERLAAESGFKVATVDLVLWRACAVGIINSRSLERQVA